MTDDQEKVCVECGHLRSEHFRDAKSCLYATDEEAWACDCKRFRTKVPRKKLEADLADQTECATALRNEATQLGEQIRQLTRQPFLDALKVVLADYSCSTGMMTVEQEVMRMSMDGVVKVPRSAASFTLSLELYLDGYDWSQAQQAIQSKGATA